MKDAYIVLSHACEEAPFTEEAGRRVSQGIRFFNVGKTRNLVFTGGYHGPNAVGEFQQTHADAMLEYALSRELPRTAVLLEDRSIDTAGQAVFTYRDFVHPRKWSDVGVITSDYHVDRVKEMFGRLYPFETRVVGVQTKVERTPELIARERKSLDAFYETFSGVTPGDVDGMVEALFTRHPWYRDLEQVLR